MHLIFLLQLIEVIVLSKIYMILAEFEKMAAAYHVNENTIVFNNMVTTKLGFETEWEVPLKKSWQNRVLA